MSNLTQSTQTTATVAPDWYTQYAQNQAAAANQGLSTAKFVGATPLQQQAFSDVNSAATQYQPTLSAAGNTLNAATTATSPLAAASPYLSQATANPAQEAAGYVSQYLKPEAQLLSDINQNNINMNLAPGANAAAIGSGQFGSTRNAQVLGQTENLANQQTNAQIANMLNTGYQNALQEAVAQNQIANQAGSTAASAAGTGQQNLTAAGQAQGNLAAQNQNLGLAGINALSTLGGQEQQIAQNAQLFPLTVAQAADQAMSGIQVPTTTNTTLTASPLSTLAALGASGAGLTQLGGGVSNLVNQGVTSLSQLFNGTPSTSSTGTGVTATQNTGAGTNLTTGTDSTSGVQGIMDSNYNISSPNSGLGITTNSNALGNYNLPTVDFGNIGTSIFGDQNS